MICRIWRGWTTPDNADAYQQILVGEVMPAIGARNIAGYRDFQCMRRDIEGEDGAPEVEFTTIMWFDDVAAVKRFVGEDYETAHVPPKPRTVLKRFEERSKHYEIFEGSRT